MPHPKVSILAKEIPAPPFGLAICVGRPPRPSRRWKHLLQAEVLGRRDLMRRNTYRPWYKFSTAGVPT